MTLQATYEGKGKYASRKNDGKVRGFWKDRERQGAAAMVVPACQAKGVIDGYITFSSMYFG